jgi:protein TonB
MKDLISQNINEASASCVSAGTHHSELFLFSPSPSSVPVAITAQPTPFAQRRRWLAWILSCAAHILLLVLALWGVERVIEEPPPTIRLVFVEPPPPPPAPLGAPAATGTAPIAEQPPAVVEKPPQEKPEEPIKPKRQEADRLKIAKKNKKPEPVSQPKPEPASPATPEPGPDMTIQGTAAPQPGVATGAVSGVPGGVVGGVAGGVVGGIIGGTGTGPLPVGQVANPPQLISRVVPDYPRLARQRGIEGLVVLEAVLDLQGKIEEDIKVLQSIPPLDDAAIKALRQWRFKPAQDHHGRVVRVILEVPIRFVLK